MKRTYEYHEDGGHDEGASVRAWVTEEDATGEETDRRDLTVEIEPNHDTLIRRAGGDPNCDHDWTSKDEGVWSTGGTSMSFASHCRTCGLHRTEYHCGSQRNPGQHDTVEYSQPSSWCAECQQEECKCDTEDK